MYLSLGFIYTSPAHIISILMIHFSTAVTLLNVLDLNSFEEQAGFKIFFRI